MTTNPPDSPTPPDVAALAREALGLANVVPRGEILSSSRAPELLRALARTVLDREGAERDLRWELANSAEHQRSELKAMQDKVIAAQSKLPSLTLVADLVRHLRYYVDAYTVPAEYDTTEQHILSLLASPPSPAPVLAHAVLSPPSPVVATEQQVAALWNEGVPSTFPAWGAMTPREKRSVLEFARALTAGAPAEEPVRSVREFDARFLPQDAERREHQKRHPDCEALFCGQHDCGSQGMACYINWPVSPNVSPAGAQTQEPRDG